MADVEDEEVPKIKLGDASCATPFTSKQGGTGINITQLGLNFFFQPVRLD